MLIAKIFVNERQIDEIHIHRLESFKGETSFHNYRIEKPKGFEEVIIKHRYDKGYNILLQTALKVIEGSK